MPGDATVGIVGDDVPAAGDGRVLVIALLAEEAGRSVAATLGRSRTSPFPIAFTKLIALIKTKLSGITIIVGLNAMGNNKFSGAIGAAFVVVELQDRGTDIVLSELGDAGVHGHGELAIEDNRAIFAVDVDVVFTEAWVDAVDDGFEVFVDQEGGRAEDHEVVVEGRDGVVEVRLREDQIHQPFAFGKPETHRGGLGTVDPANLQAEPRRGRAGLPRDQATARLRE